MKILFLIICLLLRPIYQPYIALLAAEVDCKRKQNLATPQARHWQQPVRRLYWKVGIDQVQGISSRIMQMVLM